MATQSHYRFGSDSGTESTYPFVAAEDTPISFDAGVTFLLRICIQCTGVLQSNCAPEFQYNKNAAGWNNITTSSAVARAVTTSVFANGADLTQRLSGTGTFKALQDGGTHDGISGGANMDIASTGNTETCCSIQLVAGDVSGGDTIEFRLTRNGGVLLDTYAVTPTITVTGVVAVLEGVYAPRAIRWQPAWTIAAALRSLYANVAAGPVGLPEGFVPAPLLDETGAALLDEYGHEALYDETALVEVVEVEASAQTWTIYRSRLRGWS